MFVRPFLFSAGPAVHFRSFGCILFSSIFFACFSPSSLDNLLSLFDSVCRCSNCNNRMKQQERRAKHVSSSCLLSVHLSTRIPAISLTSKLFVAFVDSSGSLLFDVLQVHSLSTGCIPHSLSSSFLLVLMLFLLFLVPHALDWWAVRRWGWRRRRRREMRPELVWLEEDLLLVARALGARFP